MGIDPTVARETFECMFPTTNLYCFTCPKNFSASGSYSVGKYSPRQNVLERLVQLGQSYKHDRPYPNDKRVFLQEELPFVPNQNHPFIFSKNTRMQIETIYLQLVLRQLQRHKHQFRKPKFFQLPAPTLQPLSLHHPQLRQTLHWSC
jgi:hypothetical protein